ncbi:MAG: choice-of-anchor J domain-containing protein, partial [Chitinophagales bacterium]|nr:choice-of-anchor J domain-containing protein [Chitinophagales bacterium]
IQPCVPAVITGSPSNTSVVCGANATFTASAMGTYPTYQWQTRGDPNTLHTMTFTNNTPLAVPDADPAGVYSTIAVSGIPAGAVITDVSIKVNIDHTYVGDMENNIIAPNGVSLNLIGELDNGSGSNSSDNFTNTIISSTGTVPLSGAAAPRTGTFRADRLSGYGPSGNYQTSANGMPWSDLYTMLNGNWQLGLSDWYTGDVGTLNNWSITFTYTLPSIWQNIVDGGIYSGATTPTLTIDPVDATMTGNQYRAIVEGGCSGPDFTSTATLTVTPIIPVVDPSSASICNGDIQSLALTNYTNVVTLIDEGFEDFGTSVPAGWVVKNNSTVPTVGLEGWDPATPTYSGIPPANTGSNYAASSFFGDNNGGGGGTMSMWLFTPEITISNGDVLKFYALALGDPTFPDRLQVRMSSNGASTDVGATPLSTGDFSTLLLDINPTYQGGVFLNAWVEYTVTVSGLAGPVNGRIAFRHFIEDDDINGYFVGLDDVRYIAAPTLAQGTWTGTAGTMWTDAAATVAYTGTPANMIYVTPSTTSTYQVSYATSICQSATTDVVVNVSQPVTGVVNPSSTAVCVGSDASFSVSASGGPLTYQWQVSTDAGVTWSNIAGATAATLNLTGVAQTMNNNRYRVVISAGPCGSVNSGSATLTVNGLPNVSISAGDLSLAPGQTTTVTGTSSPAASNWVWTLNGQILAGNSNTQLVDVDGMGTYEATVTDVNGCVSTTNQLVIGAEASDKLWIYPNPNSGQFQVRLFYQSNYGEKRVVSIFNSRGQLVERKEFILSYNSAPYLRMDFDLSKHGRGVYAVKVADVYDQKIVSGLVIID